LKDKFPQALAECLYSESYAVSETVHSIALSGITRICTYNFDDILEEALCAEGVSFSAILPDEEFNNSVDGTIVLHPHGLLTPDLNGEQLRAAKIVFSEDDFNRLYSNPYSWANVIQLSLLVNYTCLFIGVSFNDPNLRRILDVCRDLRINHRHFAVMKSPLYAAAEWEKPLQQRIKENLRLDLKNLGIEPLWVKTYDELPKILGALRAN
jgi:hypothetical protein